MAAKSLSANNTPIKTSIQSPRALNSNHTRRSKLLDALKIKDNKIYELLHDEILQNSEHSNENNDSNGDRSRSLRKRLTPIQYNIKEYYDRNSLLNKFSKSKGSENKHHLNETKGFESRVMVDKSNGFKIKIKLKDLEEKKKRKERIIIKNVTYSDKYKATSSDDSEVELNSDDNESAESTDENELPFRGIVEFPKSIIEKTKPSKKDRLNFIRTLHESEPLRLINTDRSIILDSDEANDLESNYKSISKIRCIHFRSFEIDTWYTAPYPEEYSRNKVLHICEYCLKYMNSKFIYKRHSLKCNSKHPPGNEIYRFENIAIFEIDGRKNTVYCQNLCLLAKLFLNSKTLYYDVEPFVFYVLTEIDVNGEYHFVGYFSKEKLNSSNFNVSCILTLPIYQRKGYGNFLIEFSYLLSRREFKFGTPEKPLSDLGLLSYRNYWKVTVAYQLRKINELYSNQQRLRLSINHLCKLTGMISSDVVVGLEQLESLIKIRENDEYAILIDAKKIEKVISAWEAKNYVKINPEKLIWKPMLFGPSGGINTLSTIVQTSSSSGPSPTTALQSGPTVAPALNENENSSIMNNVSMLVNFLKDDIADPRTSEQEAFDGIRESLEDIDVDEEDELANFVVCFPGMNNRWKNKNKIKKKVIVIDDDDDNDNDVSINDGNDEKEQDDSDEGEDEEEEDDEEDDDDERDDDAEEEEEVNEESEDDDEEGYVMKKPIRVSSRIFNRNRNISITKLKRRRNGSYNN